MKSVSLPRRILRDATENHLAKRLQNFVNVLPQSNASSDLHEGRQFKRPFLFTGNIKYVALYIKNRAWLEI